MRMKFALSVQIAMLGYASIAMAQTDSLKLSDALQNTLKYSPVLQQFPYELRLNEANRLQAGLSPNPEIGVALENVAGTGSSTGVSNAELTLSLSQLIEMGDKRAYRLEKTDAQQQLSRDQFELSRLDTLAATTRSYILLVELQQRADLLKTQQQREQRLLDIARQRAAASTLTDADLTRLELKLSRTALEQKANANAQQLARAELAANWAKQPDFARVAGTLDALPLLPGLAELQTSLQRSTQLKLFVSQQRLLETELALAQAESVVDWKVSGGVRRIEALNDNALVLGFSIPWQLQDTGAAKRLSAQTQLELNALQQQQSQTRLNLLVERIYLELDQLKEVSQVLKQQIIPQTTTLQQQAERAYQQGQADLFSLLTAEQELRQAQADLVSAQSRFHLQLLELERLTGQALTLSGPVRLATGDN